MQLDGRRTANCVALAILIGTYQLWLTIYVPAEVMPGSVFAVLHIVIAELQDRAPLQAQSATQFWLDCESSYNRLSQLALNLLVSPTSQAYVERLLSHF